MMGRRILTAGLALPLLSLAACGGTHQASQPAATVEQSVIDQRMKEMQAELEQMRVQQEQMKQQQEQERQQQLQLLYQQRQAAAAAGTNQPATSAPAPPTAPPSSSNRSLFPAFQWYDPSEPQQKPDVRGNDQKL